jgi:energy-coupling factor transporter ATP-binding protein EcfA2
MDTKRKRSKYFDDDSQFRKPRKFLKPQVIVDLTGDDTELSQRTAKGTKAAKTPNPPFNFQQPLPTTVFPTTGQNGQPYPEDVVFNQNEPYQRSLMSHGTSSEAGLGVKAVVSPPSSSPSMPSQSIYSSQSNREAPKLLSVRQLMPNSDMDSSSPPSINPGYNAFESPVLPAYKNTKPKKSRVKKPKTEPELCEEQQGLVNLILSGRNVFYTGSAGCGKSTVLKAFVKQLKNQGRKVVIVAPTGRAALEVNGSTYFTFAGWTPDSFKKPLKKLKENAHGIFVRKRLNQVNVLVIDEISMLENYTFERLNAIMQEARGSSKAFGGVQLVVTGDFCQLPPVKPFQTCITCGREMQELFGPSRFKCPQHGDILEVEKWAFRSAAWKLAEFEHVNLTTIHRQRDRTFIDILEKLRMGKLLDPKDTSLLLNHKSNVKNPVKLYSTREEVRRINNEEFTKLPSEKRVFRCLDNFQHNEKHKHLERKRDRCHDGSLLALREHKFETGVELKVGYSDFFFSSFSLESLTIHIGRHARHFAPKPEH